MSRTVAATEEQRHDNSMHGVMQTEVEGMCGGPEALQRGLQRGDVYQDSEGFFASRTLGWPSCDTMASLCGSLLHWQWQAPETGLDAGLCSPYGSPHLGSALECMNQSTAKTPHRKSCKSTP